MNPSLQKAEDLLFSENIPLEEVCELFHSVFGPDLDSERLMQSRRFGMRSRDGDLVAAAALEFSTDGIAYLWLCAVSARARRQGVGRHFLQATVQRCRSENCIAIRLKTYRRWDGMRRLIEKEGWTLCAAEVSKRNDGVCEIWQYPLLPHPLGIIVVGANPSGRGGEWIERILRLPGIWKLEGIVDPESSVREAWGERGIAVSADLKHGHFRRNVHAVVVAVPPASASKVQQACFERGWAVLVEKPFAASLAELAELQEALMANPVPLVTGVQRRSHPSYVALRAFLAGQQVKDLSVHIRLGRMLGDSLSGHRSNIQQCRGGALIDLGYHAMDLAQFLLNNPIEMVSCSLTAIDDLAQGIESAADVLARAGKTWVRVQIDRHGSGKSEEVRARTDEGIWLADRERVLDPSGTEVYSCDRSWELAELGRLADLAIYCRRKSNGAEDLWEHLAAFETIERAYGIAELLGLKGIGG